MDDRGGGGGGVERYDPLWRPLTGSAEGRRKSFRLSRLSVVYKCNACVI